MKMTRGRLSDVEEAVQAVMGWGLVMANSAYLGKAVKVGTFLDDAHHIIAIIPVKKRGFIDDDDLAFIVEAFRRCKP